MRILELLLLPPRFALLFLHYLCSAQRDVFAFDWLGMGASARPSFDAADQAAAELFFLEVR
jgi:hypothetical protein